MPGDEAAEASSYSWQVAFIYIFNLIVGAGALTLPKAFAQTGWLLGLITLMVLAIMSYCTSTFMIEAMSIANAVSRLKKRNPSKGSTSQIQSENHESLEEISEVSDSDLLVTDQIDDLLEPELYDISHKFEMGQLANMFFNKVGLILYYIVIALYLYGDLAIYAAAVPKSLTTVICGGVDIFANSTLLDGPCNNVETMSILDMYRIMLGVFTAALCPFVFFNLAKMKFLQIITTFFRWMAFIMMIILALIKIANNGPATSPHQDVVHNLNQLPNFFGVAVYAFMCQHSLPGIVTPVNNKKRINLIVLADFTLVALFYTLLVMTAVFSVAVTDLEDLYTLNFQTPPFCRYFLELFPVFTLSTNFPIIGITLRENLKTLFLHPSQEYGLFLRRFLFPLLTVIPPVAIAFITADVGFLVSVTGSYAGSIIQYIIPVLLVYYGRTHIRNSLGGYSNKHHSPFRQQAWIFFVIAWYIACLIFVTVHHIQH